MPSLWKLRLSMIGVFAAVTGAATLLVTIALDMLYGGSLALALPILVIVILFHFAQWLFGPYVIEAVYGVREADDPLLVSMVRRLAEATGVRVDRVGVADIPVPNAFAYGSPLAGNRVAVTRGLLETLPPEEVEAVVGHELGHLKHRDVMVMMLVSLIPALVYWLGRTLMYSGLLGGGSRREGGGGVAIAAGVALVAVSFILNLFVMYLSRLREYYADAFAATHVADGARRLQRALARIMAASGALRRLGVETAAYSQFKAFFIADPEAGIEARVANVDRLVDLIKAQKPSLLQELFSTHPHPAKRLRFLDQFA